MQLQPNEVAILTARDGDFYLTNRRITLKTKAWGQSSKIYLYLEDISSIRAEYTSQVIFLGLAILAGIGFLYFNSAAYGGAGEPAILAGLLAATFFALWFFSRKKIVSIHPNGGKPLEFHIDKLSDEQIYAMLEEIQLAKTDRINEINGKVKFASKETQFS